MSCERNTGRRVKRAIAVVGSFIVLIATACQKSQPPNTSGGAAGSRAVVVYSSADKEFAELIFRAYEQKTGVSVLPLYDTEETKTAGLTSRLVAERDHPKADVFWSSDTSRAVALVEQAVAESYIPKESAAISAGRPSVLLLDEPFSSVDRKTKASLYDLLREVSARVPGPTIYVTHHVDDAVSLADAVMALEAGRLAPAECPWDDE